MKNKIRHCIIAGLVTGILGVSIVYTSSASTVQPGSSTDPLVSKSYVDDQVAQLVRLLSQTNSQNTAADKNVLYFAPVSATKGQQLIGHEGTEIILRSGKAVGLCPGENGILDVTSGIEIFSDTEIQPNHLLIVPRLDGRGALITEDAWFIVKGEYTIK